MCNIHNEANNNDQNISISTFYNRVCDPDFRLFK